MYKIGQRDNSDRWVLFEETPFRNIATFEDKADAEFACKAFERRGDMTCACCGVLVGAVHEAGCQAQAKSPTVAERAKRAKQRLEEFTEHLERWTVLSLPPAPPEGWLWNIDRRHAIKREAVTEFFVSDLDCIWHNGHLLLVDSEPDPTDPPFFVFARTAAGDTKLAEYDDLDEAKRHLAALVAGPQVVLCPATPAERAERRGDIVGLAESLDTRQPAVRVATPAERAERAEWQEDAGQKVEPVMAAASITCKPGEVIRCPACGRSECRNFRPAYLPYPAAMQCVCGHCFEVKILASPCPECGGNIMRPGDTNALTVLDCACQPNEPDADATEIADEDAEPSAAEPEPYVRHEVQPTAPVTYHDVTIDPRAPAPDPEAGKTWRERASLFR